MIPRLSRTFVYWEEDGAHEAWRVDANDAKEWHLHFGSALKAYWHFWLRWLRLR